MMEMRDGGARPCSRPRTLLLTIFGQRHPCYFFSKRDYKLQLAKSSQGRLTTKLDKNLIRADDFKSQN